MQDNAIDISRIIRSAKEYGILDINYALPLEDVQEILEGTQDATIEAFTFALGIPKEIDDVIDRDTARDYKNKKMHLFLDFLEKNPRIRNACIVSTLGDKELALLTPIVTQHEGLRRLTLNANAVTKNGLEAFLLTGGCNPRLTSIDLFANPSEETDTVFMEYIENFASKNLYNIHWNSRKNIEHHTIKRNKEITDKLLDEIIETPIECLTGAQLRGFDARRFAIGEKIAEAGALGLGKIRAAGIQRDLRILLEDLPRFPEQGAGKELFAPAEEGFAAGFAPLDNPRLWEGKTIEDFKTIPLTKDMLEARTAKGSGLLDSAFAGLPAEDVLGHLNAQGVRVQGEHLLTADGKPSELLERLIDDGNAVKLFTPGNWQGAPVGELNRVYDALPDYQREHIGLQGLKLSLQMPAQGRAR